MGASSSNLVTSLVNLHNRLMHQLVRKCLLANKLYCEFEFESVFKRTFNELGRILNMI